MKKQATKILLLCTLCLLCALLCACSKNTLSVTYEADEGGYISGNAEQSVKKGKDAASVTAVANEGYIFDGWSDGVTDAQRADLELFADLSVTAKFAPAYTVRFEAPVGGTLSGSCTQTVKVGESCSPVTAAPDLGYRFLAWSDGTLTEEIVCTPDESTTLFPIFVIDAKDLPVISITTEEHAPIVTKESYVNCLVSIGNTELDFSLLGESARIKLRGNSTANLDKKPYKLKFDSKVDLFGAGKAKEWTLIANYSDYSLIRNYLAYSIGAQMDDVKYTTATRFVELYLNGSYDGVYLLCEQTEVGKNRVDIAEDYDKADTGYLVELDARAPTEGEQGRDYFTINDLHYAIKSPDTEDENFTAEHVAFIKAYFEQCLLALDEGDYAEICELMDVNSFADAYIVHELLKSIDVGLASFYFYKDAGGVLCCGPLWDFDLSVANSGIHPSAHSPETLYARETNIWYTKLLERPEFRALVGEKLADYEDMIRATISNTLTFVTDKRASFERNFQRWDILGTYVWPNHDAIYPLDTWDAHLDQVSTWLLCSLDYMKTQY